MRRRPTCAPRFICRCVDRRAGVGDSGVVALWRSGVAAFGPSGQGPAATPWPLCAPCRRRDRLCHAGDKPRERALPDLRPAVRTEARVGGQRRVAATARVAALRCAALRAETRIRRVDRAAARTGELAQRHVTARAALRIGRRLPPPAVTITAARIVAAVAFPARSAVMPVAMATTVSAAMTTPVAAQDPFQKAHHLRLIAASAGCRTRRLSTAAATRCRRRSGSRPRRRTRPSTSCRARRR